MERVFVVGLGEVGSAIYSIIEDSGKFELYGYDIDPNKTKNSIEEIPKEVDIMHVCIPFPNKQKFAGIVEDYIKKFNPKLVIIHSTVAPGTTRLIHEATKKPIAFSPVRGKHPYLKEHIKYWPKWVAALDADALGRASKHLEELGLKVKKYGGTPESLELAKLFETIYRALLIAWWQEMHRITRHFGGDMKVIVEFIGEVHEKLRDRPPMFPGYIGGHCLIPNTKILRSEYESKFLDIILESNELRAKELKNEDLKREIEEIKSLVSKYIVKQYFEGKPPE